MMNIYEQYFKNIAIANSLHIANSLQPNVQTRKVLIEKYTSFNFTLILKDNIGLTQSLYGFSVVPINYITNDDL